MAGGTFTVLVEKRAEDLLAAFIEVSAMNAENLQRQAVGSSMAYGENAYDNLLKRYDLGPYAATDEEEAT